MTPLSILVHTEFTERFAAYTWELGPDAGVIGLYPRMAANEGPDGNNKIFEELQEKMRSGAIPMARAGFADDSGRKSFTRHFRANFGRQCNASMEIPTTPFEEADPLVTELVRRAKAIVRDRLGVQFDFNEALCLAYLPNMSIGWHNDGEAGMGDIIVSRSFGSSREMMFAMKGAYWAGKKPTTKNEVVLTPDYPHLPGCLRMEERRALLQKFQNGDLTRKEYEDQLKEVVKENWVNIDAVSPTLLRLTIPHGGHIVMRGKNKQKYYQVSAIMPSGIHFVMLG
jgi:2OG-Fe(II) oxygenase superfamily